MRPKIIHEGKEIMPGRYAYALHRAAILDAFLSQVADGMEQIGELGKAFDTVSDMVIKLAGAMKASTVRAEDVNRADDVKKRIEQMESEAD